MSELFVFQKELFIVPVYISPTMPPIMDEPDVLAKQLSIIESELAFPTIPPRSCVPLIVPSE